MHLHIAVVNFQETSQQQTQTAAPVTPTQTPLQVLPVHPKQQQQQQQQQQHKQQKQQVKRLHQPTLRSQQQLRQEKD